ncbi:MAG: hypothetical protein AAF368_02700, partial [Planctomycetota bacterium]
MNPSQSNSRETLDLLLSRLLDRQAKAEDWQTFDAIEEDRPEVAAELVQLLRADSLLGLGLENELATLTASSCAPPAESHAPAATELAPREEHRAAAGWTTWSGWLTAAALALALLGTRLGNRDSAGAVETAPTAQELAGAAATDETTATESSDSGSSGSASRVIEELPLVVLETRPADDGEGYEVTVLRQVLESRRVEKMFGVARDEEGRPSPVPIDPAVITPPT